MTVLGVITPPVATKVAVMPETGNDLPFSKVPLSVTLPVPSDGIDVPELVSAIEVTLDAMAICAVPLTEPLVTVTVSELPMVLAVPGDRVAVTCPLESLVPVVTVTLPAVVVKVALAPATALPLASSRVPVMTEVTEPSFGSFAGAATTVIDATVPVVVDELWNEEPPQPANALAPITAAASHVLNVIRLLLRLLH